ncbi:MAG: PilZ domain-containing protein [Deltaproteobacteria bacterium]|nr:PilZ domain-containing protein [Deltaproteobacteria bacterium]
MSTGKTLRVPYGAWVTDPSGDGAPTFYLAEQLNVQEVELLAVEPPEVGRAVQLRLLVENEREVVDVQGQVVRHGGRGAAAHFAVRFTRLDGNRRRFLADLVAEAQP